MTLGEHWVDHYLGGMMLLHLLLGKESFITPRSTLTPETLIQVLDEVARGTYVPERYFAAGVAPKINLVFQQPDLVQGQQYSLIGLNAVTARNQLVSVTSGGVAYEDPMWAILAAYGVSPYNQGAKGAIPKSDTSAALWTKFPEIARSIKEGTYRSGDYFAPVDGFLSADEKPHFELVPADAAAINALRTSGVRVLGSPVRYFELYTKP